MSGHGPAVAADEAARRRAQTDFETPLLVEAGAGSGKTSILVARIVAWSLGPGWERSEARLLAQNGEAPADDVARTTLSRIVAITFTDAAAAEMATRVGEWLGRIAEGDVPAEVAAGALPGAELRRQRAKPLRAALDRLVVRTIHAWCRRLLAERPLEVGLHPAFEVDADQERTGQIVREILEQAIPRAYPDPGTPLSRLAALGHGPAAIEQAVLALVLSDSAPDLLAADPLASEPVAGLVRRLAECCRAFVDLGGERLVAGGSRAAATVESVRNTAGQLAAARSQPAIDLGALLDALQLAWDPRSIARLTTWAGLGFGKREAAAIEGDEDRIAAAAAALGRCVSHALTLEPVALDLARRALAPLLEEAHRRLRCAGVETFSALLRDASRLVAGSDAAAARIRAGIDQLLVDEFQDTDALQCAIVERIGLAEAATPVQERPTLFLVGDPRQSIYGWRSADLRAYDAFAERIEAAGGVRLHLTRNFRSLPAVLAEVKRSLERHMEPVPGVMPPFQDLVPHRSDAAGQVEHWLPWGWDGVEGAPARTRARDAVRREARAVATDIARLGREEAVPWSHVALLFRGLTDVDLYLDALRDAGVPYAVERDRRYYRRREVIEASALVRSALDPHDHVALVAWLRSASVGVPDAAWTPLWTRGFPEAMSALGSAEGERLKVALSAVAEAVAAMDPEIPGLARIAGWEASLADAVETLARLRAAAEKDPSDVFVERLRLATGIELTEASRPLGAYRAANLDQFFRELRDDLEETGGDVSEVLRRMRHAVEHEDEAEEARPRDAAENAVRVMSIHKAKGLDFPHVYLLQLHKGRGRGRSSAATTVGLGAEADEYQLLGYRTLGYDRAEEQRRRIEEAERVRTLYVAMTRPRDRLVLVGKHPMKGDGLAESHAQLLAPRRSESESPEARMVRLAAAGESSERDGQGVAWRFLGLESERPRTSEPAAGNSPGWPSPERLAAESRILAARCFEARLRAARPRVQAASALSHEATAERAHARFFPEEGGAVSPMEPTRAPDGEDGGAASRARVRAAAVGTAVHAVLESWDAAASAEISLADGVRRAASLLPALVGEAEFTGAVADAKRILEGFVASPLFDRLRAIDPHVVARELPVLLRPRPDDLALGHVVGAIDLLYREPETGEWVVADYKTDAVASDGEMRERASHYASQGGAYLRAVREALELPKPPRFELWFLTRGECLTVPELAE